MATSYPTSIDTTTTLPSPTSTTTMDGVTGGAQFEHDVVHDNLSGAVIALETAVGVTGAFNFGEVLVPNATSTTATTHTMVAGELCYCDTTSNAITVKLPQAPTDRTLALLKLVVIGGTNYVTYQTQGSDVFNKVGGGTSGTLNQTSQGILWQYQAANAVWHVVAYDIPLSDLNALYAPVATPAVWAATTAFLNGQTVSFRGSIYQNQTGATVTSNASFALDQLEATPYWTNLTVPSNTYYLRDYGAYGDGSHDDTTAFKTIVSAIATAAVDAVIILDPDLTYLVNGALDNTRNGNAIISLPVVATTSAGYVITLRCPVPSSANGTVGGAVIKTTNTGATYSSSFGPPSVIGGPCSESIGTGVTNFSNITVFIENVSFALPANSTYGAVDLARCENAHLRRGNVFAGTTLGGTQPTNNWTFGVRLPTQGNYGTVIVENYGAYNVYCGWGFDAEHTQFLNVTAKCCYIAFGNDCGTSQHHLCTGQKMQAEWCCYTLAAGWTPAAGLTASTGFACIDWSLDIEDGPTAGSPWYDVIDHIYDPNNELHGQLRFNRTENTSPGAPGTNGLTVNGGTLLSVIDLQWMPFRTFTQDSSGTDFTETWICGNPAATNPGVLIRPNGNTSTAGAVYFPSSGGFGPYSTSGYTSNACVTISAPSITSGTAFTPNASYDSELSFAFSVGGTFTMTFGPSTGAEHTIFSALTVVAGQTVTKHIPSGWKVVITLTTATITGALVQTM